MKNTNYIHQIAQQIRTKVHPNEAIVIDKMTDLYYAYAVLALSKGSAVTDEDIHNAWAAWSAEHNPKHESLKPFSDLSAEVQSYDSKYTAAVHEVADSLNQTNS